MTYRSKIVIFTKLNIILTFDRISYNNIYISRLERLNEGTGASLIERERERDKSHGVYNLWYLKRQL